MNAIFPDYLYLYQYLYRWQVNEQIFFQMICQQYHQTKATIRSYDISFLCRALCDGFYDCPDKEDENPDHCLFYKTVGFSFLLILLVFIKICLSYIVQHFHTKFRHLVKSFLCAFFHLSWYIFKWGWLNFWTK